MSTSSAQPSASLAQACARCSGDSDVEIGDVWLCLDCYHIAGSTCSGIGTLTNPVDPTC